MNIWIWRMSLTTWELIKLFASPFWQKFFCYQFKNLFKLKKKKNLKLWFTHRTPSVFYLLANGSHLQTDRLEVLILRLSKTPMTVLNNIDLTVKIAKKGSASQTMELYSRKHSTSYRKKLTSASQHISITHLLCADVSTWQETCCLVQCNMIQTYNSTCRKTTTIPLTHWIKASIVSWNVSNCCNIAMVQSFKELVLQQAFVCRSN